MSKSDKQINKLLNFADDSGLAIFDELQELNDKLEEVDASLKGIEVIKGDKGDPGKDGPEGRQGPRGEKGEPGREGYDGYDGKDSTVPGPPGRPGKDGKDGSPDTGVQIVNKVNDLPTSNDSFKIDASHIKNLPDFGKIAKDGYPKGWPQPAGAMTYRLNGAQVGRGNILNITGAGVTATRLDDGITYNITGGGGGGSPTIGLPVIGGTPTEVLYIDNAGNLYSDPLFTRNSVTNYSELLKDFSVSEQGGFRITADVTGGNLPNPVPGSFIISEDTAKNLYGLMGAGDITGFFGAPPGLLTNATIMGVYNNISFDSGNTKVYYYDGSQGGDAEFRHETDIQNGNFPSSFTANLSGFSAAADDIALQQTSGLSLRSNTISAQLYVTDIVTNYTASTLIGLTGIQNLVRPVFTGTKDWTFSMIDNVGSDNVSLSFGNITDNDRFMLLDPATGNYIFGDENGAVGGNYLHIDETGGTGGLTDLWTTNFHVQSQLPLNAPLIYIDSTVGHTRLGYNAGGNSSLLAGAQNTYVGFEAGFGGGGGGSLAQGNTALGYRAGYSLSTTGDGHVLIGNNAGDSITTAQNNVLVGYGAGRDLVTGGDNTLVGALVGELTTSANNTMLGAFAGGTNTTGEHLTFLGKAAGITNGTGNSLVLIGSGADVSGAAFSSSIGIGRAVSITASNQLKFGSNTYPIYDAYIGDYTTAQNGTFIQVDDTNQVITSKAQTTFINGGKKIKRTAVNDADHTILAGEYLISMLNLSASRTVTVPDASTAGEGVEYVIKDASGLANTWNIVLDPTGTDTIDLSATFTMTNNFQTITLVSDGVSNWEVL